MLLSSEFLGLHRLFRRGTRRASPRVSGRRYRPGVELLEDRRVLTTLFALFQSGHLVIFDGSLQAAYPGSAFLPGLQQTEMTFKMISRPATSQLYGMSSLGQLYTID